MAWSKSDIAVTCAYTHNPLQVFLTFGSVPAARSGLEKENSTPIELPSYLPEDLPVEKSAKVSCCGRWINAHM